MEPEYPPRHSKSTDEPVTIDLAAEDVTPVRDPLRQDKAVEAEAAPDDVVSGEATAEPVTSSGREDTAERQEPADPVDTRFSAPPASEPHAERKQTATSTLIAAGIFGGIVALAGAGAMQYAGYLPATAPVSSVQPTDTSALTAEIDLLKEQVAALATTPSSSSPSQDSALEQRLATLEEAVASTPVPAAATGGDAAIAALDTRIGTLAASVDQLKTDLARTTQSMQAGSDLLTERLAQTEKKLDEPRDDGAVAHAIAMTAVKTAVDRGGPFLAELDTLSSVNAEDPAVAALRPFAAAGVRSRADLAQQFPDAAFAVLEAVSQTGNEDGFADRLLTSAMSLVKVREVGNVVGDGPEAIVARMEDKLKNGDLKGAALEWDGLPEAGKTASAAFKAALDDRIRIEDIVNTAMSAAVSAGTKQN